MASNDPRDWTKQKKLRNTINNNIKTSKASYYSNAFSQSKGNSRKTCQTINELSSRRTNNTTVKEFKLNGSIISNSSELSNAFNDYFSTIGLHLANEIPPNDNNNDLSYINNINVNHNKFSFSSTSSSIVFSHLNKLCRSKDVHNNTWMCQSNFSFSMWSLNLCTLVYSLGASVIPWAFCEESKPPI